ncbi:AprI/Inh family metalloprotease inhibitor [Pseudomonas sp. FEN]|uniref:AprI/Inh family metalloprotease inhibitor n=1 Tax=Pseudomonas sp. FEN TaxID=2767468 RepID=UPI001747EA60|nr:AprI/Inh family metalloprotease inhibitor [Pseudomonas sp. FEN]
MASSLILTPPEALAGQWRMYPEGANAQVCELDLALQIPRLSGDLECIAGWLGERPTNWEPTPDGLWLYGIEGTGIVHFNRQKTDRYEVRLKSGGVLVLVRDTP